MTLSFVLWFGFHDATNEWVQRNLAMFYVALIVMFVSLLVMACCENVRRKAPLNFIFLGIFTLAESYIVAMSTIRFKPDDVCIFELSLSVKPNSTFPRIGSTCHRLNDCCVRGSHTLCLPNKMGLHHDGRHSVCSADFVVPVWLDCHVLPG